MKHNKRLLIYSAVIAGIAAGPAKADKPDSISISGNKPGSSMHAEITGIADAIDKKFGTKIRAIPVGNAVGRAVALKNGKTKIWMSCSAYYTAFEGIGDFAAQKWGPQDIRVLMLANRRNNFSLATSKKSPINTVADIKGKRMAWVVGNSGINMQTEAYLSHGGLTLDDVELVKFPGYVASLRGVISGQTDAVMAANSSSATREIAASPGGLKWININHANKDGWKEVQRRAPFVAPLVITGGPGLKDGEKAEVGSYPCPTFVAYSNASVNDVYWLTKMIVESWDIYKDSIKTAPYWQVDEALKSRFAVPYHDGAVKYFKEIGKWTDDMEKQQQRLLKRTKVLQSAFAKAKSSYSGDPKEFAAYWNKEKAAALKAAGF
ncbi:MAG: TAXI family TRAP transporter solute-binding subunit [Hyphomicrobiaceae bacterium]|nr:TAXI family TRAP transporter solute-binding subunit [Hyphomicrobiaceae bacterium]